MLGRRASWVIRPSVPTFRARGLVATAVFVLCSASSAFGATLYVGPRETYTTIQAGVDAAKPGDTVIVRDGIYTDRTRVYCPVLVNVSRGGTDETRRITIKAEHKWGAVLDGWSERHTLGFRIGEGVSYVTIRDFEIRNCGTVSARFEDWGVGISSWGNQRTPPRLHNTFRGNYIHHCDLGLDDCGTSEYYTIDGNVLHHIGGEYHKHPIYFTSNNTFVRGSRSSPMVFTGDLDNITIQNNIFYDPPRGHPVIDLYQRYHPRSRDNIASTTVRNNLLYGRDSALYTPEIAAFITESSNITGDPQFVDATPGVDDFHLRSGSPAIGAGIAALAPDHDLDGKTRPAGGAYDLGAFEAGGDSPQVGTLAENQGISARNSRRAAWATLGIASLPEGCGISARHPGDRGIDKDPAVVFAEDFEVSDLDELRTRWSELGTTNLADERRTALSLDAGAPEGSPGARSLRITATKGEDSGGFAYKVLPAGYDRLFLRFYAKFADDYGFCHHFSGMCGSVQPPPVLRGAAGVRPENSWRSLADAEGSYVQNVGIVV